MYFKLSKLNSLDEDQAKATFSQCCSATRWVGMMVRSLPYDNTDSVVEHARYYWRQMGREDYQEAFDGHPKIGDPASLKEKYRNTHHLASSEQSSVEVASDRVLEELADLNNQYEKRFGFIFIVCASGKSAEEMLSLIRQRIQNEPDTEIRIPASEQDKITILRIRKLLEPD